MYMYIFKLDQIPSNGSEDNVQKSSFADADPDRIHAKTEFCDQAMFYSACSAIETS